VPLTPATRCRQDDSHDHSHHDEANDADDNELEETNADHAAFLPLLVQGLTAFVVASACRCGHRHDNSDDNRNHQGDNCQNR
jgi:ABC-type nickel/cobalt efflux system permease component RcnA